MFWELVLVAIGLVSNASRLVFMFIRLDMKRNCTHTLHLSLTIDFLDPTPLVSQSSQDRVWHPLSSSLLEGGNTLLRGGGS